MNRCFYFGCWNEAGHYLFAPGGGHVPHKEEQKIVYYGDHMHLDASLAPRRLRADWVRDGNGLCWSGQGKVPGSHLSIEYCSGEYPQGRFLLHHLDNGFTAIQWWDRCQGDTRGACNSTVLLEGVHTSEEMRTALRGSFPHVLENLKRGGPLPPRRPPNEFWKPEPLQPPVELVEVKTVKFLASLASRGGTELTRRVPCQFGINGEPRARFAAKDLAQGDVAEVLLVWSACCGELVGVLRMKKLVVTDHGKVHNIPVPVVPMYDGLPDVAEC